jgi:hypothetical protein
MSSTTPQRAAGLRQPPVTSFASLASGAARDGVQIRALVRYRRSSWIRTRNASKSLATSIQVPSAELATTRGVVRPV